MYINCLLSRMAGAYDSCVSIQLRFPFLSTCFRVSSSHLSTRTCGTTVHLVPCLTISLLLSIPLSLHLIWDDNQPRSHYHSYTAYVRNRSYTRSIPSRTPYQGWNTNKPNVSHLREFGTPVHILLQGQQMQRKILPKTHQHFYVGNEDNSNSIIYYSKETRRLNVSRNYYFINDNHHNADINDPAHEGERPGEATRTGPNASEINNQDINAHNSNETPTQIPTTDKGRNEIKLPQKCTHDIIEPTDKDVPH